MPARTPFVVSVLGLKKSGKTTVCEALIASLSARGYRVGALKKTHQPRLDLDPKGRDSSRLAEAGASFVAVRSLEETVTIERGETKKDFRDLLALFPPSIQLIVAEGISSPQSEPPRMILCLNESSRFEETLRVRGIKESDILALSGVFAAAAHNTQGQHACPVFDVLNPKEREQLCALILARAANPRPAGPPCGPLAKDLSWKPGSTAGRAGAGPLAPSGG